ncbi:phosphotransferase [Specibacter sp. AOP5-B1-6]|uniref:phosphotransferase n=1 Tax=Specibacter sp. AOP5-B1-6 TaxID=3457653 RepID=UPI00402BBCE6
MVLRSMSVEVEAWCFRVLGHGTLTSLRAEAGGQMSHLFRYDSDEQGTVAVKVRSDSADRISRCLQIQRIAADAGFPCARPLTGADLLEPGGVVSAETWLPGGEMRSGGEVSFAARSAKLLADLMEILVSQSPTGLGAPPPWMHWNPPTGGLWPTNPVVDEMNQDLVPGHVHDIARSVSQRLAQGVLPLVVGHGDWESQNLRWHGELPWAVHDWDSLVALPEAAIVGAASGAFASTAIPTLATIESSEIFFDSYQQARGRRFTKEEQEVAWAASVWPALHNARGESLFQSRPVALDALTCQAAERLQRAGVP